MVKKNHPIRLLFPVIASGEIDQLISSLRTLLIFLPFWERQQLAMDAMEMISKCYVCWKGSIGGGAWVAVFSSQSLWENDLVEELIITGVYIARLSCISSYRKSSISIAADLIDAGWANVLVKALTFDCDSTHFILSAISSLLDENPTGYKTAFIASGAIETLQEVLERGSFHLYSESICVKALEILTKES